MSTKLTIYVLLVLATSALASTRRILRRGKRINFNGDKITASQVSSATALMSSLKHYLGSWMPNMSKIKLVNYATQDVRGPRTSMVWEATPLPRNGKNFLCVRVQQYSDSKRAQKMLGFRWHGSTRSA